VRAISERTGIPRSTVADRVARVRDAMPVLIVGRDGRRYLAVRDPRIDEPASSEAPLAVMSSYEAPTEADPGPGLRRHLCPRSLRQPRDLGPDVVPLAEHDRLRITLDLAAIARLAAVREADAMRPRAAGRRTTRDPSRS
jgi:hypothetical protein